MKTFVMGDIHGGYKALLQCLQRANFDYENDTLIQLGDVADGWSETYECVEELLKIKNLIAIKGNHDEWALDWFEIGIHPSINQGGRATIDSYNRIWEAGGEFKPESHREFFKKQHLYYVDDKNRCFVHGGFNRHYGIKNQANSYIYYWDRDLFSQALSYELTMNEESKAKYKFKTKDNFDEIFIGHTSTTNFDAKKIGRTEEELTLPLKATNIWNLDTGGGWDGKLTIMDVDTKEFWQSDLVYELYPFENGRK